MPNVKIAKKWMKMSVSSDQADIPAVVKVAYFMDTWSILWSFVRFYGHLVRGNLVYFSRFGIFTKKPGNHGPPQLLHR
jgi:hypothetical protein